MKKKKKQAWGQVHEEAKEIRRRKAVQSYREEREEREKEKEKQKKNSACKPK